MAIGMVSTPPILLMKPAVKFFETSQRTRAAMACFVVGVARIGAVLLSELLRRDEGSGALKSSVYEPEA